MSRGNRRDRIRKRRDAERKQGPLSYTIMASPVNALYYITSAKERELMIGGFRLFDEAVDALRDLIETDKELSSFKHRRRIWEPDFSTPRLMEDTKDDLQRIRGVDILEVGKDEVGPLEIPRNINEVYWLVHMPVWLFLIGEYEHDVVDIGGDMTPVEQKYFTQLALIREYQHGGGIMWVGRPKPMATVAAADIEARQLYMCLRTARYLCGSKILDTLGEFHESDLRLDFNGLPE